jgi:pectate lyase
MSRRMMTLVVLTLWLGAASPHLAWSKSPAPPPPPIVPKVPTGLPAFPGAEGFGAGATGGRGGRVIYVTNNNPSGPGSFTEALFTPGKRTILFAVSGTIPYPCRWITEGDFTLIGTTAPGEGVEILGRFPIAASNIIVRGMRFSMRPPLDEDAVQTKDVQRNVIFDHCSFRYGSDELVRFKGNGATLGRVDGLTLQYCIFGPGLAGLGCHPWGAELDG